MKANGKRELETDGDPPVFVIGSRGSKHAMEHLNKRGQHIFSGIAQTLLHIHEAAEPTTHIRGASTSRSLGSGIALVEDSR